MTLKCSLIGFLCVTTLNVWAEGETVTPVSAKFIGVWKQSKECAVHPLMKGDIKIQLAADKTFLEVDRPNTPVPHRFNGGYIVTEKDKEGVEYRTTVETESYMNGKKVLAASIWKKTSPPTPEDGRNLAVIITAYELKDDDTMIFEKYGYTSMEEKNQYKLKKYSDMFPNNYHCKYTRAKN